MYCKARFSTPPLVTWVALSLCLLLSPLQAQDLHITLLNGDCDGDNEVTLFDFGIVVNAFGSTPSDPNWDPRADLDGDCEVTLFDYGIVVRNFGAVGAEPFDPALPRQPAPSEGYELQGSIELEGWIGAEQPVRIEALREDDPEQIVYWMEVQSSTPFTLHLPQSGLWWVKVSGTENSLARCLVGQSAAKRLYLAGDPIQAFFVTPREGEAFADASYDPAPIGVSVYAQDYDWVFFYSADGTETLSNRERTTYSTSAWPMNPTLLFHWEIVSGGGSIAPISPFSPCAVYTPPILEPDETERSVTLRCTVTDLSLDLLRRDLLGTQITRTFRIVNRPTVHVSVAAVDPGGNLLSTTPIPSGQNLASRLRFTAGKRGTAWNMDSVTFTTPWVSVTMLNPSGEPVISFTTEPISRDEPHRRFQFGASAVFSITVPPPFNWRIERQDEKTAERLLGFDIYYLPPYDRSYTNELIDDSRGQSVLGTWDVPNWFHNRAGHWGNVIPRFNEQYTYGGVSYPIVHWIPMRLEEILQELGEDTEDLRQLGAEVLGFFDWQGVLAPYQYAPAYRGRIYIFPGAVQAAPLPDPYGLQAGGIDLIARVVAHEFAHRDLFIADWGGFDNSNIGPPGDWFPMSGVQGIDKDRDCLSDNYERTTVYHFDPEVYDALHRWWEGKQGCEAAVGLADFEMYSRLYGEWNHYWIGSLDSQDWSVGGRQDYEGGN